MIKTLIFDIGNVLVYFDHFKACKQLAKLYNQNSDRVYEAMFSSHLETKYECGLMNSKDFFQTFNDAMEVHHVGFADFSLAFADIFIENQKLTRILPNLKSQGYRLCLLSNTSSLHIDYIRKNFEFFRYFDAASYSFEVGAMKPSSAIFQDALGKALALPDECFYIDDIPEYVDAAKSHGIRSVPYTSDHDYHDLLAKA